MKIRLAFLALILSALTCFSQNPVSELNSMLSNYASNIKTDNNPHENSCIYDTGYMNVSQSGNILTITYGFYGAGSQIYKFTAKVDLTTDTICNGYWYNSFGNWQHNGNKKLFLSATLTV